MVLKLILLVLFCIPALYFSVFFLDKLVADLQEQANETMHERLRRSAYNATLEDHYKQVKKVTTRKKTGKKKNSNLSLLSSDKRVKR